MIARLAAWCYRNRWKVVIGWIVLLIGVYAWGGAIGGSKPDGKFEIPQSDSRSGLDVLQSKFKNIGGGGFTGSIVFQSDREVTDPAVKGPMTKMFGEVGR